MRQAYTLGLIKFNAGVLANCCRVRKTLTPVQIMLFAGSVSRALLLWGGWVECFCMQHEQTDTRIHARIYAQQEYS